VESTSQLMRNFLNSHIIVIRGRIIWIWCLIRISHTPECRHDRFWPHPGSYLLRNVVSFSRRAPNSVEGYSQRCFQNTGPVLYASMREHSNVMLSSPGNAEAALAGSPCVLSWPTDWRPRDLAGGATAGDDDTTGVRSRDSLIISKQQLVKSLLKLQMCDWCVNDVWVNESWKV
jgi:hypothetical protein